MTSDERNVVEQALGLLEEVYDDLPEGENADAINESINLLDSLFESDGEGDHD